jgi:Kef-type K+ transport system membrane component KefB
MGALATWADSEAVLPAYMIGMVLAGTVGKDHMLIRRLRTLTFGLLTPFYFIRAGSFVSVPDLIAAPMMFLVLLLAKMATKSIGVYPTTKFFKYAHREGMYTTLLMSTGLTFGTISALFGLQNKIISQEQYSVLVTVVILSAFVPTLIAQKFFQPTVRTMVAWGRLYQRKVNGKSTTAAQPIGKYWSVTTARKADARPSNAPPPWPANSERN